MDWLECQLEGGGSGRVSGFQTVATDHEQLRTKKKHILILILAQPAHVLGQLYTFQAL